MFFCYSIFWTNDRDYAQFTAFLLVCIIFSSQRAETTTSIKKKKNFLRIWSQHSVLLVQQPASRVINGIMCFLVFPFTEAR